MKEYLNNYLIKIDFNNNEFKYCNVVVQKPNKNLIQVLSYTGKLGNKGRTTVLYEFSGENIMEGLKECIEIAKAHINQKKLSGFLLKESLEEKIKEVKSKHCDLCNDIIANEWYDKINQWARNEGGWDENPKFVGYNKVICVPCQIQHNIFKKIYKNKKANKKPQ